MNVVAPKRCDLCDGEGFQTIAQLDRHGQPLATEICRCCGLVAHAAIPSDPELADYYGQQYRRDYHGEVTPSPKRVMRAWRNGERIFAQVAPHLPDGASVLEVGAGIGCTVKRFELGGFPAQGIEPNDGFQRFSRDRLRTNVERRNLTDLSPQASHDLILLVHVIEHFSQPTRSLKHLHALLRPEGRLYVECPNLAAPFATRSRLFHFAHVHNFTPSSLIMLAQKCGFAVEKRFSADDDPDLRILFRRIEPGELHIDPDNFGRTLKALERYNALTYHLRWNYLWPRLKKVTSYLTEQVMAKQFVRRILTQCADASRQSEMERFGDDVAEAYQRLNRRPEGADQIQSVPELTGEKVPP